jgi:hypothetical protein
MRLADRAVSLAAVVLLAGCAGNGDDSMQMSRAESPANPAAASSAQSCFAPLPGHPTSAEQRTFVQEVGQLAVAAERTYGVPAAALTAMAIQESGYGWTSLAQQTNNILAWKYTTSSAAGGRGSWEFDCGGASDRYIVFADRAQAIDFVAKQLATSQNYADATARYREERAKGVPTAEAVETWVDDIADPYSSQSEAYRTAIKRVMNDPFSPSTDRAPDDNLFRLSESVQTRGNAV